MKKDISIREGSIGRKFTTEKLRTALNEGGKCYWIEKDDLELTSLFVHENGVYVPETYGFSSVHVSVMEYASYVQGYDFDAGDYKIITRDPWGYIAEQVIPYNFPDLDFANHVIGYDGYHNLHIYTYDSVPGFHPMRTSGTLIDVTLPDSFSGFFDFESKFNSDSVIAYDYGSGVYDIVTFDSSTGIATVTEFPYTFIDLDKNEIALSAVPSLNLDDGFLWGVNPDTGSYGIVTVGDDGSITITDLPYGFDDLDASDGYLWGTDQETGDYELITIGENGDVAITDLPYEIVDFDFGDGSAWGVDPETGGYSYISENSDGSISIIDMPDGFNGDYLGDGYGWSLDPGTGNYELTTISEDGNLTTTELPFDFEDFSFDHGNGESVIGFDRETGNEIGVSMNPGRNGVTVTSLPSKIVVTTPPNKTDYVVTEDFDPTGMVVTAKNRDDSVWTNSQYLSGIIPLNELTINALWRGFNTFDTNDINVNIGNFEKRKIKSDPEVTEVKNERNYYGAKRVYSIRTYDYQDGVGFLKIICKLRTRAFFETSSSKAVITPVNGAKYFFVNEYGIVGESGFDGEANTRYVFVMGDNQDIGISVQLSYTRVYLTVPNLPSGTELDNYDLVESDEKTFTVSYTQDLEQHITYGHGSSGVNGSRPVYWFCAAISAVSKFTPDTNSNYIDFDGTKYDSWNYGCSEYIENTNIWCVPSDVSSKIYTYMNNKSSWVPDIVYDDGKAIHVVEVSWPRPVDNKILSDKILCNVLW